MTHKPKGKQFTDAERHKRFVDKAKEVEASEDPKDFEKAFDKIAAAQKSGNAARGKSKAE